MSRRLLQLVLAGVMLSVTALLYLPLLFLVVQVMEPVTWPGPLFHGLQQLLFLRPRLLPALATTLVVAIPAALLGLLLGVPAGYGLVQRLRQQRRQWRQQHHHLFALFVVTRLLPPLAIGIPLLEVTRATGPVAPVVALMLVYAGFGAALTTGLAYRVFSRIPQEWEEAAWLLGLSRREAICQVVWPLVRQDVLAIGGLLVVGVANEVVLASLLSPVRPTAGAVAFRWWPELGMADTSPALLATAGLLFAAPGWLWLAVSGGRLLAVWGVHGRAQRRRHVWQKE